MTTEKKSETLNSSETARVLGISEAALSYQRLKKLCPKPDHVAGQFFYKAKEIIEHMQSKIDDANAELVNANARLAQIIEQRK